MSCTVPPSPLLPPRDEMLAAFLSRDAAYEGVFVTSVVTTGIFCRPTCPARKPRPENVTFHATARDALLAGFRPCRRCEPLVPAGERPAWLAPLLDLVDGDPALRWRDGDLRAAGFCPVRVRRWFLAHHGMTFHAYSRARRLGQALGQVQHGGAVTRAALDAGWESASGFAEAFARFAGGPPTRRRDAPLLAVTRLPSPLGPLVAAASDDALWLLEFADRRGLPKQVERLVARTGCLLAPGGNALLDGLVVQLEQYFAGGRTAFDVPLHLPGTAFQRSVWDALRRIPPGTTCSYSELARRIGRPAAVRAVARANGDNRIALLVPCHRVVGSDGQLTGYAGGLWRKQRLLELESAAVATAAAAPAER